MGAQQYIDMSGAFPELREVLPRAPVYRNGMPVNARPEPVTPRAPTPKSYREGLAERVARSPFTPGAIEMLLKEFAPGWYSGTPIQRILRAGRSDADVELFVSRLESPRENLPPRLYGSLYALKLLRDRQ